MITPDNIEQPNEEVQELTDENLEEVSGGLPTLGSSIDFDVSLVAPVAGSLPPLPVTHD